MFWSPASTAVDAPQRTSHAFQSRHGQRRHSAPPGREQYIDYSAQQHCINQQYWDQPKKQEEALLALEKKLGINEDNYTALDDLAMTYDQDTEVLEAIEARAREICPPDM